MHGLERHYFGSAGVGSLQQLLQVSAVVVAEDEALGSAVPDALNHRRMVPCIRVDLTPWKKQRKRHSASPPSADGMRSRECDQMCQ